MGDDLAFATCAWLALFLGFAVCVADAALDRWRWRRVAEGCRTAALRARIEWHKGD